MKNNERMLLDSDLLRTFVVIAQCGNLTVAAGRLYRTQSAISVQLRKLEEGLGTKLFLRTSKGMTLTAAGETLLPRAKSILSDLIETAEMFSEPLSGSIRVGLPDDFEDVVLERILEGFSRAHPGVQVMATTGCASGYAKAVESGSLDVVVCSGPDNRRGEPLNAEETVWATSRKTNLPIQDVVPLAILDRKCWWRDLPANVLDAVGRKYETAFLSSSFASLQAALRAGFAVGILPKSSVSEDLKVLGKADGFPELPVSQRTILVSDQAPGALTDAMVEAIQAARHSTV